MQDFTNKIEFMSNQEESKRLFKDSFIPSTSEDDINIVAEDYEELLKKGKYAEIFASEAEGEEALLQAMQEIMDSISSLDTMVGVVFRFNIHPDVQMLELLKALDLFEDYEEKIMIIWSTLTDKSLHLDYAKISALIVYEESIKK